MRNGVGEATGGTWPTYSGCVCGGEGGVQDEEAWEGKRKRRGREGGRWRRSSGEEKKREK